jgi:hypothetical protein
MATLLAKKAGAESPIALDDDHHEALAADPAVSQFPASSTFGAIINGNSTTATTGPATGFAASSTPATGFGAASGGFGSPAATTAATSTSSPNAAAVAPNPAMLASTGGAMQSGGESTVELDKDATDWINKKMRPMMGWIYMLTCTCDFVVFPVLWSLLQALSKGQVTSQWQPLTLQGAGLYHIAMGAVLGIAAYGRTKEKVAGVA